jgi:serine/threonine protein phosphatase PrpC
MCGVPYDHHIHLPPGLRLQAVHLDERCGLRCSPEDPARLMGTPLQDGTHVLRLECLDASGATVMGEARLVISRDPRSLWRTLPSNRGSPHWKSDHASQRVECGGWRGYGISRRGRSHANVGKCREDEVGLHCVSEQLIAAAVADGAGSAALSRLGSQVAVTAAMQVLVCLPITPSREALRARLAQAALAAHEALEDAALQYGAVPAELATTLLLCVLVPGPEPLAACLQIGDGVIAARVADTIRPLCAVDRGEYASQTVFQSAASVAAKELATRIHVEALPALRWILLASDGVTDPYLETEQAMHDAQCWVPLAAALERAAAMAPEAAETHLSEWLDAFTPGHHDDRTLVLLHPMVTGARP